MCHFSCCPLEHSFGAPIHHNTKVIAILLMRLETVNRHLGEFECIIQSIYSGAKCYHSTSVQINAEICQRVFDTNKYNHLPIWAKSKIYDILNHFRKKTTDMYVRLFYIGLDGRKIPTYKSWDLFTEEEKELCRTNTLTIHHIWMEETIQRNDDGSEIITLTPTDKVYWFDRIKETE